MEWGNEILRCPRAGGAGYDCEHIRVSLKRLNCELFAGRSRYNQTVLLIHFV